ncbi:MAG: NAD kinase [Proteobacteria bacterium]|nr:NAD kinase [Pseudomonadota bacterium]
MKIALLASKKRDNTPEMDVLRKTINAVEPKEADVIVTLGGDGFLLRTLHEHVHLGKPFYGLHRGTHGFLLNEFGSSDNLETAIKASSPVHVHPLRMQAKKLDGSVSEHIAFNEVSITRTGVQAAKLKITVDGKIRVEQLVGDGVLLATPMGSTAYNLSAYGPILPLNANLLALTPICPFRPRRWSGALLEDNAKVKIDVLDADRRGVHAIADFHEVDDVTSTEIILDKSVTATILFAEGNSLEDRILAEQFGF